MSKCKFSDAQHMIGDCKGEVSVHHAMTAYHWEEKSGEPDPNADFMACEQHAEEYRQFWQDQWDEYYNVVGRY